LVTNTYGWQYRSHGTAGGELAKKSQKKKADAKDIAEPVRELMRSLLKEQLKTIDSRKRVAEALGKSPSTLNSLLYQGKGGFDLMVSALIVALELDDASLMGFLDQIKQTVRESVPASAADKRWFALSEFIDEAEKERWVSVIETYIRLSSK
jgi:23S rRNA maturation mini-RNase III